MTTTVLFIWDVPERLRTYLEDGLKGFQGVRLIFPSPANEDEYLGLSADADIIVGWRPSRDLLDKAQNLKLFVNPGAGVQHQIGIFREINKTRDVVLVNGHGNTYFTAQHGVALLLALMNKVIPHHNWMVRGHWRTGDSDGKSTPLRDRHIGLLGYGAVNSKVHRMLSGFDVRFSALKRNADPIVDPPAPVDQFVEDGLHEFLRGIDILFVAVPETDKTKGLIGKYELELLGRDGLVVNLGRGSILDEKEIFNALQNGIIAGAAIDVWYDYRPEPDGEGKKWPYNFPFHELENVVLSPHRGASPMDDLKRWDEVIENIRRMSAGESEFLNSVDLHEGY